MISSKNNLKIGHFNENRFNYIIIFVATKYITNLSVYYSYIIRFQMITH